MDTLIVIGLLIGLGYLLGIIGFFRAGQAIGEVRELRRLLQAERGWRDQPEVPVTLPGSAPTPPEPAPPAEDAAATEPPPLPAPPLRPASDPPPPPPPPPPTPSPQPTPRPDLESVLTMRWAAWLGAVALLLAGVFLVRYAAEQGLLGPATRCGAAALLGAALLAGAEWLQRRDLPPIEGPLATDQAPPALAAGGVAVLFGAAYGAGPFYDLVPPTVAFAAMAAVSFLGMAAALHFGPLTAAVGIVGAFVSPALVQTSAPSLLALFAYLALATAAAYETVWRTAWTWLGWAVAIAGATWVVLAALNPYDPQIWAAAAYVPIVAFLGLRIPAVAVAQALGRTLAWGQLAIVAAAGLVLEAAAPGTPTRLALFALAPLAIAKGLVAPSLDRLPWLAALVGLVDLLLWNGGTHVPLLGTPIEGDGSVLVAAAGFAALHAFVGLQCETRAPGTVRWSALVAAVPLLALAICYAMVGHLEPDIRWGLAGLLLAIALTATTRRAMTRDAPACAGAHAAGAVAALALALGMTLRDQWLSDALALILPGLAWIEARTPLPALRKIALVVAAGTLALLWWRLGLDVSGSSRLAAPVSTYALPALAFFAAARMFRVRRDDAIVAVLEAGAMGLAALYVVLQIRAWFGRARLDAPFGFDEAATIMLAAAAQALAYDAIAARAPRATVLVARAILAGVAGLIALGLLLANPLVSEARVGSLSLVLAYLVPAAVAGFACLQRARPPAIEKLLGGYAVAASFAWTTFAVRHAFHGDAMAFGRLGDAELWAYSGAWLAYGLALMGCGIVLRRRTLRLVALAVVAAVCAKVFLWDMADLTGLWRVASFLGLGLSLIGLAAVHRRFVLPMREAG